MWLNSMISVLILKSSIATSKVVLLLLGELFVLGLLHNLQGPGNHLGCIYPTPITYYYPHIIH